MPQPIVPLPWGVKVDEEHPASLQGEGACKIDGGRRLADPSFLISDTKDLRHKFVVQTSCGPLTSVVSMSNSNARPSSARMLT